MNNKTAITTTLILILLAAPTLGINYTKQYCENNQTLITEHYYWNGTANITTQIHREQPYYGCINNSPVTPGPSFHYGSLVIGGLIGFIALNLALIFALKPKHGAIQFALFILTLILLYFLAVSIGIIGEPYTSIQNIEAGTELMYGLARTYFWFIFLVLGYFIITMLKNILQSASHGGKDYSTWGD